MMKKIIMTIAVVLTVSLGVGSLSAAPVSAAPAACDDSAVFLGFRPWYMGLSRDCSMISPDELPGGVAEYIWTIVLNILSDLFVAVGYLALGFIIYGGYLYVLARGDPSRIAKGKRTVISAVIGLIICILAALIVGTIANILTGAVGA